MPSLIKGLLEKRMEISEIKDRESLEKWLDNKPSVWRQVIVLRLALRMAPLGFAIVQIEGLSEEIKHDFTLKVFRANLISSVAHLYRID